MPHIEIICPVDSQTKTVWVDTEESPRSGNRTPFVKVWNIDCDDMDEDSLVCGNRCSAWRYSG